MRTILFALLFVAMTFAIAAGAFWLDDANVANPFYRPARADGGDLPPCTPIAATGNIVISRCEDSETGMTIYVNNIGFLQVVE